ncbi:MAG: alkaline phosphatase [Clostridiales bacterium]|nr:alkaline phosphatase [Clostridiales bacterium]
MKAKILSLAAAVLLLCSLFLSAGCSIRADYLIGDVNGDGVVDAWDAYTLSRYLSGRFTPISDENADLSFDGAITETDMQVLLEYLAGISKPGTRYASITINGVDLEQYRIVIPEKDASFAAWAADQLRDELENSCGVRLSIVTDDKAESEYEILIGDTSRAESENSVEFSPLSYMIYTEGSKIVLLGRDFMVGGGVGYLTHTLLSSSDGWNTQADITVPEDKLVREYQPQTAESVILIIGDGMGQNHIRMACDPDAQVQSPDGSVISAGADFVETFWAAQFPAAGTASTGNVLGGVTDSAAAATALSTGWKTRNGVLGMRPDSFLGDDAESLRSVQNVRELASLSGRTTAILSTDRITGATPNAFLVHHSYRYDYSIVRQQQEALAESELACDFLWCSYDDDDLLEQLQKAIHAALVNDSGFFLMAEEAMIDKYATKLDYSETIRTVSRLNDCVAYAALTAACHPDIAVIVTADHETGGLTILEDGSYAWTSGGEHTGVPVPVYAIGGGTEVFHSTLVENTDIAKYIASVFGAVSFGE